MAAASQSQEPVELASQGQRDPRVDDSPPATPPSSSPSVAGVVVAANDRDADTPPSENSREASLAGVPAAATRRYGRQRIKLRQLRLVIGQLMLAIPLIIFTIYYLDQALVADQPQLGLMKVLSPPRAILLISLLTSLVSILLPVIILHLWDLLRWQRLRSDNGVPALHFLALSGAISVEGSALLTAKLGTHWLWTWQKMLLPLFGLFFGIIAFANIYIVPGFTLGSSIDVFAGLAPLNASLLKEPPNGPPGVAVQVPPAVLATYYSSWLSSISGVPKFATLIDTIRCTGEKCSAIFLPGGIEQIRLHLRGMDRTLLDSGMYKGADTLIVNNAPGYHLEFSPPDDRFRFDQANDCSLYGKDNNQGLYVCVASYGDAIIGGWSVCPGEIQQASNCYHDQTWTWPPQETMSMLSFRRLATTAYDHRNLSIIEIRDISPVTEANATVYEAQDFRDIFHDFLSVQSIGSSNNPYASAQDNLIMVLASLYEIGWVLRLYHEVFRDDSSSPIGLLENMFILPIHFSVSAWILVNATIEQNLPLDANYSSLGLDYSLPEDLSTTVTGANVALRLTASPWTVYAFAGSAGALVTYCVVLLLRIVWSKEGLLENTGFHEVDVASKAALPPDLEHSAINKSSLASVLRADNMDTGPSWSVVKALQEKRFRMQEINTAEDTVSRNTILVFDTPSASRFSAEDHSTTPGEKTQPEIECSGV